MRVITLVVLIVALTSCAHANNKRGSCSSDPVGMIANSLRLCK